MEPSISILCPVTELNITKPSHKPETNQENRRKTKSRQTQQKGRKRNLKTQLGDKGLQNREDRIQEQTI